MALESQQAPLPVIPRATSGAGAGTGPPRRPGMPPRAPCARREEVGFGGVSGAVDADMDELRVVEAGTPAPLAGHVAPAGIGRASRCRHGSARGCPRAGRDSSGRCAPMQDTMRDVRSTAPDRAVILLEARGAPRLPAEDPVTAAFLPAAGRSASRRPTAAYPGLLCQIRKTPTCACSTSLPPFLRCCPQRAPFWAST